MTTPDEKPRPDRWELYERFAPAIRAYAARRVERTPSTTSSPTRSPSRGAASRARATRCRGCTASRGASSTATGARTPGAASPFADDYAERVLDQRTLPDTAEHRAALTLR